MKLLKLAIVPMMALAVSSQAAGADEERIERLEQRPRDDRRDNDRGRPLGGPGIERTET